MQRQLATIEAEFRSATERLERLAASQSAERWTLRPAPDHWSMADCVDHLNRTAEKFVPAMRDALAQHAGAPRDPRVRYRRDPLGWALSLVMPPPVRFMRVKTSGAFEPSSQTPRDQLVERFLALQEQQIGCLHEADGLPLGRIRIKSPFDGRVTYNLYSCFVILPRHEHRHLWQAEQVAGALKKPEAR